MCEMDSTSSRRRASRRDAWEYSLTNALGACIIAYCVVSAIAGQAGLIAFGDLKAGIVAMEGRAADMDKEIARLTELKAALALDRDRQAREARDIGYVRSDEKIITFVGTGGQIGSQGTDAAGELEPLRSGRSTGLPDRIVKILAGLSGLAVLLASFIIAKTEQRGFSREGKS